MPTIRQNIEKVIEDIAKDPDLTTKFRDGAVAAIYAGEGSAEWREYMENFAGSPINAVQLARLTGVGDVPCNEWIRPARAYLIANGTCGTPTFHNYLLGVTDNLDVTLPVGPAADPSVPDGESES